MVGLADSFRQSARIRDFGLSEAINQAYVTDFSFLLVLTLVLVIGGSIWWNFLPRKIFNQPKTICSPECLHAIQGKNEKSEVSLSSWDEIFEMFKEEKFLDPLKLVPDNKTRALAIFVSVILFTLALIFSVSPEGKKMLMSIMKFIYSHLPRAPPIRDLPEKKKGGGINEEDSKERRKREKEIRLSLC